MNIQSPKLWTAREFLKPIVFNLLFYFFRAIKLFEGMMKTMNLLPRKIHINIAAAAAKSLQSCPTLCDPTDGSHQAPPSLGFSRQEHWNGLPFPSPMHESEKWKGSRSVVSDPQRPHGLQPTSLLHPWEFPGKSPGVGCHCLLRVGI